MECKYENARMKKEFDFDNNRIDILNNIIILDGA